MYIAAYDTLMPAPEDGVDGVDGDDGVDGQSSFTSYVFCRSAADDTPAKPTSAMGSFASPSPDGSGFKVSKTGSTTKTYSWYDGIPADTGEHYPVWMSSRIFTSDGKSPQQSAWSDPKMMTDSSYFDVEYSTKESPSAPSGHPNTNLVSSGGDWSNEPSSDAIWMATSTCANGAWSDWVVARIKGENGIGTSIRFRYDRVKPETPATDTLQGWFEAPTKFEPEISIEMDETNPWRKAADGYYEIDLNGSDTTNETSCDVTWEANAAGQFIVIHMVVVGQDNGYADGETPVAMSFKIESQTNVQKLSHTINNKTGEAYLYLYAIEAGDCSIRMTYSSAGYLQPRWRRIPLFLCYASTATVSAKGIYRFTEPVIYIPDTNSTESVYLLSAEKKVPDTPVSDHYETDFIPPLYDDYDSTMTYSKGAGVTYNKKAWQCIVNSCTGQTPSSGSTYWEQVPTWTDEPQNPTTSHPYQYAAVRYKENAVWGDFGTPYLFTDKGLTGDTGVGIAADTMYFQATNSTAAPAVTVVSGKFSNKAGKWSTASQPLSADTPYLWALRVVDYTDGTQSRSAPYIAGNYSSDIYKATKVPYLAGVWQSTIEYTPTEYETPYVYHNGQYYVLIKTSSSKGENPSADTSADVWAHMEHYQQLIVNALVADLARIGGAVFYQNDDKGVAYMFSQYGYHDDTGDEDYNPAEPAAWADLVAAAMGEEGSGKFIPQLLLDFRKGKIFAQDAFIRGVIYATDGVFRGTVYANNGSFTGEVNATSGKFTNVVVTGDITANYSHHKLITAITDNSTGKLFINLNEQEGDYIIGNGKATTVYLPELQVGECREYTVVNSVSSSDTSVLTELTMCFMYRNDDSSAKKISSSNGSGTTSGSDGGTFGGISDDYEIAGTTKLAAIYYGLGTNGVGSIPAGQFKLIGYCVDEDNIEWRIIKTDSHTNASGKSL
jgi:hypothetical protein